MFYGDGGAGKTTLAIDLACHLAAGEPWLEIPVPRPVRVLLIENEGPRPLLRRKLRRKLEAWAGAPLEGRVCVFAAPWGRFTLASGVARGARQNVREHEIDVVIAGPLTRIGMDAAGTLQEVRAFMELVAGRAPRLRAAADRRADPPREQGRCGVGRVGGLWRHAAARPGGGQRPHGHGRAEGAVGERAARPGDASRVDRRRGVRARGALSAICSPRSLSTCSSIHSGP